MCGICGLWNLNDSPVNASLLVDMRDILAHRGPDGAGCLLVDANSESEPVLFEHLEELAGRDLTLAGYQVGLGHRRLSIIDLSTGDQPMCNEDGSVWIIYNGELYNYRELRPELEARGHVFRSVSDTEVILHAYEEYGTDCPVHFNGIFAFAIWDARNRSLFLSRDHFGVKPVYYCLNDETFYFASELKSILCDPNVPVDVDVDALNLCLTFRYTPSPWTLLRGIHKVPPGCSLYVTAGGDVRTIRYWDGPDEIDHSLTEEAWVERLQSALEEAVVRQMVSDVPIGISLSSGIDSSVILALMSQYSPGKVNAFTVGFSGQGDTSEIEPARQTAARYNANFEARVITEMDYAEFMEKYIWHLEEPIGNDSSAAYYFVAEMARQAGVKVLLNGQGPDEAFAGYARHLWARYAQWFRLGAFQPFRWMIPRLFGGSSSIGESYQRFLYVAGSGSVQNHLLQTYSILSSEAKTALIRGDVLAQMNDGLPANFVERQIARAPHGTPLETMTYVDTRTSLPDNLLLCEDKMAMATSVEARVPFLDLEFMDVAERIPGAFKRRALRDKYIHRNACARWVGKKVAARPKIGFDNALDHWLRGQLGEQIRETVISPDSFASTYLNTSFVLSIMQEHAEGRRDHRRLLFLLLALENWHDIFVRNNGQRMSRRPPGADVERSTTNRINEDLQTTISAISP